MSASALPRRWLTLALSAALAAGSATAAAPPEALAAEQAGDWNRAAAIYRRALEMPTHAQDAALWTRLGEVEARAGHAEAAAQAYARAADLQRDDADAQRAASRAYATAQQPKPALEYLERAIALRPEDDALKIDRVRLANWLADYPLAERTLEELLAKDPQRRDVSADLGRVRAWQGRLGEADALFAQHLAAHPDDRLAWIDRARIAIWNGDYARAVALLDAHDAQFPSPPDAAAAAERARALAWAGRWREAQSVNAPLRDGAAAVGPFFTQALLHRHHHRPVEALPWLARVQALQPDARETADLARGTWLPLRSRIGGDAGHFEDSADIEVDTLGARGAWRFGGASWLRADVQRREFSAPLDGPFSSVTDRRGIDERRATIALAHAPSAGLALWLQLGRSSVDVMRLRVAGADAELFPGRSAHTIGRAGVDWRGSDEWSLAFEAGRDRVAASPRSLSLDLTRRWIGAAAEWRPDLRWRAQARFESTHLSDDNDALVLDASVWRAVHRSRAWQWDLGAVANWQSYDDPALGTGRGYYAPDGYRRVQLAARGYWRWTDEHGLALDVASGVQRDDDSGGWKSASDASAEAVFGIFSDWELRLRAAWSDRRQASGSFDARSIGASVEYRF